jgi:hypothetical protein
VVVEPIEGAQVEGLELIHELDFQSDIVSSNVLTRQKTKMFFPSLGN